jgi:hypothetical protein
MQMLGSKTDTERVPQERAPAERVAEPEPPAEPEITDGDIPF